MAGFRIRRLRQQSPNPEAPIPIAMAHLMLGIRGTSAKIQDKGGFDDFPENAVSTHVLDIDPALLARDPNSLRKLRELSS